MQRGEFGEAVARAIRKAEPFNGAAFAVENRDRIGSTVIDFEPGRVVAPVFIDKGDVIDRDARAESQRVLSGEVDQVVLAVARVEAVGGVAAAAQQGVVACAARERGRPVMRVRQGLACCGARHFVSGRAALHR